MVYGFNEDKSKANLTYPLGGYVYYNVPVCKRNTNSNEYAVFIPINTQLYNNITVRNLSIYINGDLYTISADKLTIGEQINGIHISFTNTSGYDIAGYLASVLCIHS